MLTKRKTKKLIKKTTTTKLEWIVNYKLVSMCNNRP